MWNRVERRNRSNVVSKVFHDPPPPPPPLSCVFSPVFVCIFVDKGACIINEASLDEPLVDAAVTNRSKRRNPGSRSVSGIDYRGGGGGRGKWAKNDAGEKCFILLFGKTWKTFDYHFFAVVEDEEGGEGLVVRRWLAGLSSRPSRK